MDYIEKCKIDIGSLFIHNKEKYSFYMNKENDMFRIIGDIKGNLIIHSNIEKLRIKPLSEEFSLCFRYFGKFEFIRFRVTTSNPQKDYQDIIIYACDKSRDINLHIENFDLNDQIVVDFGIYGSNVDLSISDIIIDFNSNKEINSIYSKIIKQYSKKFLVKDYKMLMAPEPHSQERALAVYDSLNKKKNVKTIDLGAGGAPMMSELLLRKGKGTVDALVYNKDDVRKAKRYLKEYNDRVQIINGDLTDKSSLPNEQYDQILLLDVLEHIQDEKLVLNNIKSFFKENTKLIITVPNINYKDIMSKEFHNYVGHVRDGYTISMISKLLEENGYEIIEAFNFAKSSEKFYNMWYKKLKAWRTSYQYSELAYEFVIDNFNPLKEKLNDNEGISNCIVCRLKE